MSQENIDALQAKVTEQWRALLDKSPFIRLILDETVDPRLYALYMIETFHYTKHNARNQALVGAMRGNISSAYQKFCFDHAMEETGHEFMALKDLQSLGVKREYVESSLPLPETEALIAYLYWVSLTGNPLGRLGYSFWAESVYEHINHLLDKIRGDLALEPKHMTFFIAHAEIDDAHAAEVKETILQQCRSSEDWQAVERVMERSLYLTGIMLDGVYHAYRQLEAGKCDHYGYLHDLSRS